MVDQQACAWQHNMHLIEVGELIRKHTRPRTVHIKLLLAWHATCGGSLRQLQARLSSAGHRDACWRWLLMRRSEHSIRLHVDTRQAYSIKRISSLAIAWGVRYCRGIRSVFEGRSHGGSTPRACLRGFLRLVARSCTRCQQVELNSAGCSIRPAHLPYFADPPPLPGVRQFDTHCGHILRPMSRL